MSLMQAIVNDRYGPPDVLSLRADVEVPTCPDDRVLVRIAAASVNPYDWYTVTGTPLLSRIGGGLRRPKDRVRGVDMAGTVVAIGRDATTFRVGDEVFGAARGSFAEYGCSREGAIAIKPSELSFEQAAAIPIAGLTALQALRDKAGLQPGQRVLINGAAGGVGTFAVQIAKALGASVTGVCSGANVELVRSLGADEVIDYGVADFAAGADGHFDVMLDNVGNRSLAECRRVLTPKGVYVIVGGPKKGRLLGPLRRMVAANVAFAVRSQKAAAFIARHDGADLTFIVGLVTSGALTPVVTRTCSLADVPDALREIGEGHVRGKIAVKV